jgi:putative thioredoxin
MILNRDRKRIMSESHPFIIETTDETFATDVLARSREIPVVVDFWAEWCGPCRMLGPRLEQFAQEAGGSFVLVKADTERCPEAAATFGVRSIPAVFGVKDGNVVDSFVGVLPESTLRAWIDRLQPTADELLVAEARRLAKDDPEGAEAKYRAALALAPGNRAAMLELAQLLAGTNRVEECRALLERLEAGGSLESEGAKLKAELTLRARADGSGSVDAARAEAAANPGAPAVQLKLADALAAAQNYEEALEIYLRLVEQDRKGTGEAARKSMLAIFQVLGEDSEIVNDYRRKLSAALY